MPSSRSTAIATLPASWALSANIGHLNTVAGLAGLMKAVQVVRTGKIPATLNFAGENPLLDLGAGRFRVCDRLTHLPKSARYSAAVSSFGFGGTNVHVILSTASGAETADDAFDGAPSLLCWSARTPDDLAAMDANLAAFWKEGDVAAVRDDAGTLLNGRKHFEHRHAVVAQTAGDAGRRSCGITIFSHHGGPIGVHNSR